MDAFFYTVAKSLILPPGGLILCFLLGFFLVRGVLGRVLILIGISVLLLMSLPALSQRFWTGLEPYPALEPATLTDTEADGILILGAGRYSRAPEYEGDTVGPGSLVRLRYGAFLHRHTGLPVYITGGSPPSEYPPVGRLMGRVLEEDFGITPAGVEDRSQTTYENARFSAPILARDGIDRVLLVTHAWHLPRAMGVFAGAGIEATPAPTQFVQRPQEDDWSYRDWLPAASAFSASSYALHEHLGQAWYRLKGRME